MNKFNKKIIIIGDVIIDKYIDGEVKRISPEAPVPVMNRKKEFTRLGGASNVAVNVTRLVGSCKLVLDGKNADINIDILTSENIELIWNNNETRYCTKTRLISGQHQLLRIDDDVYKKRTFNDYKTILGVLNEGDIVLISDYEKGAAHCSKEIINYCNTKNIYTIVDPKNPNWEQYRGAKTIKCNKKEYLDHRKTDGLELEINSECLSNSIKKYSLNNLIVTLGSEGLLIVDSNGKSKKYGTKDLHVYDVSGAGDAVAAGVSYLVANELSILKNGSFLCELGGLCVQQIGTSPVPKDFIYENFNL